MAEFYNGVVDIKSWVETEKKNFDLLDKNKNGFLEGKELMPLASDSFQKFAAETNWYGGKKHSEAEINGRFQEEMLKLIAEHDRDGDGRINFEEYQNMMRKILMQIHASSVDAFMRKV